MPDPTHSFGYWLRRRRRALDLTQEALAQRVSCSGFSIRKIEADERRPSRRLAERLAAALAIPEDERRDFMNAARALRAVERLQVDAVPLGDPIPVSASPLAGLPTDLQSAPAPFVGRSREFALLAGLIARLPEGSGYTVLIEGEPGIGKSRMLRELAIHAHALRVPTLATNCYEIERATPYQPVVELVTRVLEQASPAALHDMAPVSLAELAALVPEINERFTGLPQLSNDFPEARQARLCRAVGQLIDAASGGGARILMVDDVQWADDASAQVLHYLARQAARHPLLVIYAYRDEAIDSDERFGRWTASLHRETYARRVLLPRLDYADTANLVTTLTPGSDRVTELAERLHRETEGNPFFLMSILQSLNEGETRMEHRGNAGPAMLPDALRASVRVRVRHVPNEFRSVLETAAVLGRRFDFDTLLDVTQQSEAHLLEAVEALIRRRLLREETESGLYDFSHDKVREVVYHDTSGARRRLLHLAVAEALERRDEGRTHERDARLAEHYERAHAWTKALRYLVLAGERSQALFALRDALHWLDRAVALTESHPDALDATQRLELYARRGAARVQAGQTQGAVVDFRRVLDAARASGKPGETRDALVQLGMAYRRADEYREATACLTEALEQCRAMNDAHQAADTLYHLGTVAWSSGLNDQAIGFHQQAVELCERDGFDDLIAVQAYHGRGEAHFANAEPAAAIACYTRSLELARSIGDKSYEAENLMMIGHACVGSKGLGDYPRAIASFEAALAMVRAADLQWHLGPTLLGLEHAHACLGRYGEAWTGMREMLRSLEELGQVRYQLIAHDFLGQLLLDVGLNELAVDQLERGLLLGRDSGIMFWRASITASTAIAHARLGKREFRGELAAALDQARRSSELYLTARCIDALAEISLADDDALSCLTYANELLAIAEANELREHMANARRWRGEAMLTTKAFPAALSELSTAAKLAEDIGRVRLQMDVQDAIGRLLTAQGQKKAAQRPIARAHDIRAAIARSFQAAGKAP